MDRWVLRARPGWEFHYSDGFYTGKSYIHHGSKYAIVDNDIKEAKPYSTYPRAIAACNKLCFENYRFEVVRQSDFE